MNIVRTQIRLPESVHQLIVEIAAKNNRSMNGEIVKILSEATEKERPVKKSE